MGYISKWALLAGIILLGIHDVRAEDVRVSVSSPAEVAPGESFRLSFTINARPDDFQAPSFNPFRLISGPSQSSSTSTQIINNQVTTSISISYTYVLEAPEAGTYRIPPARAVVDEKSYASDAIVIKVSDDAASRTPQTPTRPQDQNAQTGKPDKDDIFIRAVADKNSPYQGEQVIIRYLLYTRLPITNYSIEDLPAYQGLWHETLSGTAQPSVTTEVINDISYNVAEIRRVAVYPQRSGEIRIEPMEVDMSVRMRAPQRPGSRSFFDDFFSGTPFDGFQTIRHREISNAVSLRVKPLPAQNKPASFTGLVGQYTISGNLNPQSLDVNDAANLVIAIEGKGNLRLMDEPRQQFPPTLDVFDPQISDQITTNLQGLSGNRTFDYVIIPRQAGQVEIPALQFSYFDPGTESYVTLQTGPFALNVTGEPAPGHGTARDRSDLQVFTEDIRFIHTQPIHWRPVGKYFYKSPLFYGLISLPFIGFLFFLLMWSRQNKLRDNQQLQKTRQAEKIARKRLRQAAIYMKEGKQDAFYDEIFKALWGFVSDRLNIPGAKLNKDNVSIAFERKKISPELARKFLEGLEECEFARFSPSRQINPMEGTYHKAMDTIITLEKQLRNPKSST